jgi:hypothetical protein
MMVDTGYTLAHNGGPIFNKGMMYSGYNHNIYALLDIQRSGQVPEYILDKEYTFITKTPLAKKIVTLTQQHLPKEFRGFVDFYQVVPVGGHMNWTTYQNQMKKSHPDYVSPVKTGETQVVLPKTEPEAPWIDEDEFPVNDGSKKFQVFPGQFVKIVERVA